MHEYLYAAEVAWKQIESIVEEAKEKYRCDDLLPWYHEEARWILKARRPRGETSVDIYFAPCTETSSAGYFFAPVLFIESRVFEKGWVVICPRRQIAVRARRLRKMYGYRIAVPLRKFKEELEKVIQETFAKTK